MKIGSEEEFVDALSKAIGLQHEPIHLISELKPYLNSTGKIQVYWLNSQASKNTMVRKSDVPMEDLPQGGSSMQRDIVLDLVWAKQSLTEKAREMLRDLDNIKLIMK
jgi:hypothetical protein